MNPERSNERTLFDAIGAHGKLRDNVILTLIQLGTRPPRNWLREASAHFTSRSFLTTEEGSDDSDEWASDVSRVSNWSQNAAMPTIHRGGFLRQRAERYNSPFTYSDIEEVIRTGNLEQFKSMWIMGQRNSPCPNCTLISCAIRFGQPCILEWLIDREYETDDKHSAIGCPIHFHPDETMIEGDNAQDIPRKAPWYCAADPELNPVLPKVLSRYLAQARNPTILDEFPETPLITALRARNYAAAGIIIDHVKENKEKYR